MEETRIIRMEEQLKNVATDVSEIKDDVKTIVSATAEHSTRLSNHELRLNGQDATQADQAKRISEVEKNVWKGLGILAVITFIVPHILPIIFPSTSTKDSSVSQHFKL